MHSNLNEILSITAHYNFTTENSWMLCAVLFSVDLELLLDTPQDRCGSKQYSWVEWVIPEHMPPVVVSAVGADPNARDWVLEALPVDVWPGPPSPSFLESYTWTSIPENGALRGCLTRCCFGCVGRAACVVACSSAASCLAPGAHWTFPSASTVSLITMMLKPPVG